MNDPASCLIVIGMILAVASFYEIGGDSDAKYYSRMDIYALKKAEAMDAGLK